MPPGRPGPEPRQRRVTWPRATRIVAARYPPIDLFERVSSDPAVWEALIAAEQMVNPRLRDEVGEIRLVPPGERVSGPGASYVMAAFTHRNPAGSRFSDGHAGVYYAARTLRTAVRETAFHFGRIAADSRDPPRYEDMRVLVGRINCRFADVAALPAATRARLLDPDSYAASQAFGDALRAAGAAGVVYPSVRDAGGECVGAFRPTAVGIPVPGKSLKYHWDGARVGRYFDYERGAWVAV
ncbi:RES family NAD+ phosphorylase [bacterium]|nr:RES family NAD+ phosphorylase [bacterium]